MSFFRALEQALSGGGAAPDRLPDHACARCQVAMEYKGPHALRTGGLNRGWGVAADVLLGAGDETALNELMEKNVVVHVFVCPQCGALDLVNDPRRGF
ncbi:conserved protein of unknown function [Candidatus Hydrogenisulfobacillus filiaventi]|uniref:Uncharacterized protein n=1 Tax=Candidatus Hydrogenisulfobacillus filiaventi TaxID=2707344 RepID=A0A6F8ZFN0_9FIRM|nr:hypothetical protein [Bacillota bacterium]CAB1128443.1 conserved protein of unknown function [Candidatus Hydrogenisulfobacillus filiaventi]